MAKNEQLARVGPFTPVPRLGISRCLLGESVRYDGGHKHDRLLFQELGRVVEWVPICPEVEAGLGTPREAMRLVGDVAWPQRNQASHCTTDINQSLCS